MTSLPSRLRTFAAVCLAGGALAGSAVFGQTIINPSFEADAFANAPGLISNNVLITGWSVLDINKAGLNPAGGQNPYANNGTVPNGTNVAFLIPTNVLTTTISGLEIGSNYMLRFRVNAQTAQRPALRIGLDDAPIFEAGGVAPQGGTAQYLYVAVPFTATAASHTLSISNNTTMAGLTNVLLLDDFNIGLNTSKWSVAAWTDDASSGVDSSKNYTHAYAFGVSGVPFPINGVNFTRISGGGPQAPYELQTANLGSTTTDPGNVLKTAAGGSSSNLAHGFVYNGNPEIFTFENLVPGMEYVATFYSVGWDPRTYGRAATWAVGNDRLSMNEDHFGDGVGIRISYRYTAPASGYFSISNFPFSTAVGTLHIFGLANYEANPQTTPLIGLQPANKASIPGGGAGFYITAGGARPLSFRWMKEGVEIANQTNRTLILTNLTTGDLAGYSVSVSNSFGVVTSSVAALTFDTAVIPNPSFEADTYLTYPGYSSGNFPIAGWISSNPARTGINPAADVLNPFGNTGTVPDGRNAAFIQGAGTTSLRTTISGLTAGSNYTVQFRSNGRSQTSARAQLKLSIDDNTIVDTTHNPVGGTNAYRYVAFDFIATSNTAVLGLTNDTTSDFSVNVDNFTIAPSTSKWTFAIWTNDATAGIDPTKLYTHAYHFGPAVTDTNISGLTFRGLPGANPSVPGFLSMSGFGSTFSGDANMLTINGDGSAVVASTFIYGGPVQIITLSNLLPGTEYVASIYGVAFDAKGYGRSATFNANGDLKTINLDHFGLDNGIIVSYPYTASSNGTFTITYTPTDSASTFHTYAFANRVANDSAPVIAFQPQDAFVPLGDTATFSIGLSAGSLPMSFQWQQGGSDLLDQTNISLVLSNFTTFGTTADYRVILSNAFGVVTSTVASLEVGARVREIFNTGVNDQGALLAGGAIDPHYQLIRSDDPTFPGPDAMVLFDVWPATNGVYMTNGPLSKWLSPRADLTNVTGSGNLPGLYVFRTSFVLDSVDPGRAQINGLWSSDNDGLDLRLNGISTGFSNSNARTFASYSSFRITNGLVAGSNTLEFVITNQPPTGPIALRVELSGVGRPLPPTAPKIVSQPRSQTVAQMDNVAFEVLASGSPTLTYQWYFEDFELEFETNRVLRLTHVSQFDQQGSYRVAVINSEGVTNSTVAVLTVIVAPSILAGPSNQVAECGSTAGFSVAADGDTPLSYQWYFGTNALIGQTEPNLTLPAVGPAQAGLYRIVVSNSIRTATASATLTVVDTTPPVITNCAPSQTLTANEAGQATLPDLTLLVQAGDSCGGLTITQSPAGGTLLGLGQTNVLITVKDAANNTNLCTVAITVQPFVSDVRLAIETQGTNAVLSWPTSAGPDWKVWQTDTLAPSRSWSEVTNSVSTAGDRFSVTVDRLADKRFFRLQKP